jgi:hypothetical protein
MSQTVRSLSLAAGALAAAVASTSSADLIAGWTIPTAFPTGAGNVPTGLSYQVPLALEPDGTFNANPNPTGNNPNPGGAQWDPALAGRADIGARALQAGFSLSSHHQLASSGSTPTSYTSPAGNGSAYSFNSNVWKAGDYYQVLFDTSNYSGVSLSFDMTRSATGAATFEVVMSLDGGVSFTTLVDSFGVLVAGSGGTSSWSATGTVQSAFTSTLALGEMASDASSVMIRIRALVDGLSSTGAFAPAGTVRIDNVMVNGNLIPAPGAIALLGLAGLTGGTRRRR